MKTATNRHRRTAAYERLWGPCASVHHEVTPRDPHVDVHVHPPHGDREFTTLITSGMSDAPISLPAPYGDARGEVVMYVREPKDAHIEMLRFLAHYPHDTGRWIWQGTTLPNGDPPAPFFPRSQLCVALLTRPIIEPDSELGKHLVIGGKAVELLWVVPITRAECDLKVAKGSDALYALFNEHRLPHVLDESRKSYVGGPRRAAKPRKAAAPARKKARR